MSHQQFNDAVKNLRSDPPKPGHIRVSILIENNGFVQFGNFHTKDFQFEGDFRKSRPIELKATAAKNQEFLSWSLKTETGKEFIFVSDQTEATIKNPVRNMIIKASFTSDIS